MSDKITNEDIEAEEDDLKIAYVQHPISTKEKKAILRKYDKILDARFSPDGKPNVILERQKGDAKKAPAKKAAAKKEEE